MSKQEENINTQKRVRTHICMILVRIHVNHYHTYRHTQMYVKVDEAQIEGKLK